jgi:hypothetical protein
MLAAGLFGLFIVILNSMWDKTDDDDDDEELGYDNCWYKRYDGRYGGWCRRLRTRVEDVAQRRLKN